MDRRVFLSTATFTALVPASLLAHKSDATPSASPTEHDIEREQDTTHRDLVRTLEQISPVTLLEALETAVVTDETLLVIGGEDTTSVPWIDFGDTDLYSSLGGVGITTGSDALSDPDTQMVGGYIVYESAKIAYHELIRKLGDLYDNPSMTMSTAGTNFFVLESDDFQIGVGRVGYVLLLGMIDITNQIGGEVMEGLVHHLAEVADTVTQSANS